MPIHETLPTSQSATSATTSGSPHVPPSAQYSSLWETTGSETTAVHTSTYTVPEPTLFSAGIERFSHLAKDSLEKQVLADAPAQPSATPRIRRIPRFLAEEMWEGVVVEVFADYFGARLSSLLSDEPEEYAEVFLKEVSLEDRELIEEGALFTWSIGYLDGTTGQRTGASVLRFRRLAAISPPTDTDPWILKVQDNWINFSDSAQT
jgi:hypothetical protein